MFVYCLNMHQCFGTVVLLRLRHKRRVCIVLFVFVSLVKVVTCFRVMYYNVV